MVRTEQMGDAQPLQPAILQREVTGHQLDRLGRCETFGELLAANETTVLVFLRHYG